MICEKCLSKQATVHLQQIINGEKSEVHLCADCAALQPEMTISFDDFFQGFLDSFLIRPEAVNRNVLQCPNCGMTARQFKSLGRLGCAQCYDTFREDLSAIFKSVQAGNIHQGKYPRKFGSQMHLKRQLQNLKVSLARAIENEAFEEAAKLRDEIKKAQLEAERSEYNGNLG